MNHPEDYYQKVSYHDLEGTPPESSSESGQLLVNKKKNIASLMLALYYNYYGENFYYALFGQGQAGEGDKDTFLNANHVLGLPYYHVKEYAREIHPGRIYSDDEKKEATAIIQYDPEKDYLQSLGDNYFDDSEYNPNKSNYGRHVFKNSSVLFFHCSTPKLSILPNDLGKLGNAMKEKKRAYGKYLYYEAGFDMELEIWKVLEWALCEHSNIDESLRSNKVFTCESVKAQIELLKNDIPEVPDPE